MKILILGHKGMLGHMVHKFFLSKGIECITTQCRFPSPCFKRSIKKFDGEYIINCIGAIHQRTDKFDVNFELPKWLDKNMQQRIIYPGTDCDTDNDSYSISKKIASKWIRKESKNTKIIKTSIFGPELNNKYSLMEWFLSQEGEIDGYSEYYWNGNTTLTWAQYCLYLMFNWDKLPTENILEGECMSKYNLLLLLKEIYNKDIIINPIDNPTFNKCIVGTTKTLPLKEQIIALKEFY
jgi:dTDP-4-dehydrorhamnose reductase|tara:strand:+ start:4900 stop:5610 length:711 start_codon:yes stop_codon:yes gene_type:complete